MIEDRHGSSELTELSGFGAEAGGATCRYVGAGDALVDAVDDEVERAVGAADHADPRPQGQRVKVARVATARRDVVGHHRRAAARRNDAERQRFSGTLRNIAEHHETARNIAELRRLVTYFNIVQLSPIPRKAQYRSGNVDVLNLSMYLYRLIWFIYDNSLVSLVLEMITSENRKIAQKNLQKVGETELKNTKTCFSPRTIVIIYSEP